MVDNLLNAHAPLRIGTRRSNLAVVQAEGIRDSLQKIAPDRSYQIETLHTLGDRDQSTALYNFGDKSLWTTELEEKLTSGQLDVIVHCLKDMPTKLPDSCELAAIPQRDDPRDALIVKAGLPYTSLQTLPERRRRGYVPQLRFANLRGNVETRLAKVDDPASEYTCMVMSAAWLERIGLQSRISQYLGSKDGGIFHAVGQGALGLEIRRGDAHMQELLNRLADTKSTLACLAERSLMRTLEGGCSVPIGVETEWVQPDQLRISAIVVSLDGSKSVEDTLEARIATTCEAEVLAQNLAARLAQAGAGAILNDINANRPAKD
ncbi:putative porphobilinogen deaminase Hem3 [Aspergillus homomorphus CBS 101889]|uniref:Porphobilinogen deaminase n=1 Tax=Aspergillus homomorphus (strain CBS 101889) TaxID=1450537 RepID=A0A395HQ79_ASPHC|nr:putative porphobilinogen deaminase Hem3 [Aspergillus homomorphus CBS 101889]RAL09900.1 putative porphobilinogen deaminase Hem3 [Aspergillus homomorphus CBS 101889]